MKYFFESDGRMNYDALQINPWKKNTIFFKKLIFINNINKILITEEWSWGYLEKWVFDKQ